MIIATISINADQPDDIRTILEKLNQDLRVRAIHDATNGREIVAFTDHAIATLSWIQAEMP